MGLFKKKNYIAEWMDMSDEMKERMVRAVYNGYIESFFRMTFIKYPPSEVGNLIKTWKDMAEEQGWFKDFVEEITSGYQETGLNKPAKRVIQEFIANYVKYYMNKWINDSQTSNNSDEIIEDLKNGFIEAIKKMNDEQREAAFDWSEQIVKDYGAIMLKCNKSGTHSGGIDGICNPLNLL